MFKRAVFLFLFLASLIYAKQFHTIAGPFTIVVRRMENCPRELQGVREIEFEGNFRNRRLRASVFNANITLHFVLDDSSTAVVNLASWSNNGGWKDNAHILTMQKVCSRFLDSYFRKQKEHVMRMVFGEILHCPFFPGVYHIVNMTFPARMLDSPFIQQFLYGRWRMDLKLKEEGTNQLRGCVRAFLDTVPK